MTYQQKYIENKNNYHNLYNLHIGGESLKRGLLKVTLCQEGNLGSPTNSNTTGGSTKGNPLSGGSTKTNPLPGGAKYNKSKVLKKVNMEKFRKAFKEPFSYINHSRLSKTTRRKQKRDENDPFEDERYKLENFTLTMFDKNFKSENIDLNALNFPEDIVEVYDYQEGIDDEKPWHFIGKIKYKNTHKYIYYIADADYTGFDCQGYMKMYISKSLKRILYYAAEEGIHENYYVRLIDD